MPPSTSMLWSVLTTSMHHHCPAITSASTSRLPVLRLLQVQVYTTRYIRMSLWTYMLPGQDLSKRLSVLIGPTSLATRTRIITCLIFLSSLTTTTIWNLAYENVYEQWRTMALLTCYLDGGVSERQEEEGYSKGFVNSLCSTHVSFVDACICVTIYGPCHYRIFILRLLEPRHSTRILLTLTVMCVGIPCRGA
ncbi:hypothetical protein BDQ12DRAFT_406437 [Crucibulum laeve]|uniref:Uncharacterized protein n=1 Tax=Crucibulum laeve TaxID=68775 RepID=A0A5C3LKA0_9AGAR|nr:hypothetical protein BDQ12DRAFT_406437 [Crucibulum laeve]